MYPMLDMIIPNTAVIPTMFMRVGSDKVADHEPSNKYGNGFVLEETVMFVKVLNMLNMFSLK